MAAVRATQPGKRLLSPPAHLLAMWFLASKESRRLPHDFQNYDTTSMSRKEKMRRFQHIVVAACLMVLLVMNTSVAGPWCGSDTSLIYRLWNYTQADSDWWPSADLVDFVSIVDTGGLSFLQWARLACVPFGFAYFGEGCRVHDECYDGLAYPGASRQQCDQVAKDMWIDACNRQYPAPEWWEAWRWPVPLCREYCEATAEVMMAGLSVFAGEAWEAQPQTERRMLPRYMVARRSVYRSNASR